MNLITIILVGIGLAMDAFAVSISRGISIKKMKPIYPITIGLYFGVFQFAMPILGYFLGNFFAGVMQSYSYLISFILLSIIGGKMIYESFHSDERDNFLKESEILNAKSLSVLAIATSIDAFAVGVTLALSNVNIMFATSIIGIIAFICSSVGVLIGKKIGNLFQRNSEIIGGVILILIGIKMLVDNFIF